MKSVLLLGAGMVARPLVHYLLDHSDIRLTIASRTRSKADLLIGGHARGTTHTLKADDAQALDALVAGHDLVISLLPAPLHPEVAGRCIAHRRPLVTTSYVSPEMLALDGPARGAGVLLLNEIGVDPGIDHMSAMRVIDQIKRRGGQLLGFKSYCGGLPAPENNDNPLGYKVSWSPLAICRAFRNAARFLSEGREIHVPSERLAASREHLEFEGVGELEAYPNRDSLTYVDVYGLRGVQTMYRGTLRYPGWCETLHALGTLGLLAEQPRDCAAGTTRAQFTTGRPGQTATEARLCAVERLGLDAGSAVLERLEWLGLFDEDVLTAADAGLVPIEVLAGAMDQRMRYAEHERDMIVLHHEFHAAFPGESDEQITSTMISFGAPGGDSAMARTVSLPAAIATRLILDGKLAFSGVHIPVMAELYEPVLEELARFDICCVERSSMLQPGDDVGQLLHHHKDGH